MKTLNFLCGHFISRTPANMRVLQRRFGQRVVPGLLTSLFLFAAILTAFLIIPVYGADSALDTPNLTSPEQNATFNNYPRSVNFSWEAVMGASKYCIEIQCLVKDLSTGKDNWIQCIKRYTTNIHSSIDTFPGAQPGRWRVTAVDSHGKLGQSSEWWKFRFTK
jgi:hypothetical protein